MRNLRLRNFRSFRDTGRINLRPITILVGANSSGKSSYLRFFPLLRQTAETASRSPFLWFGRLVDFGEFSKTASHQSDSVSVDFDIDVESISARRRSRRDTAPLEVSVSIDLKAAGGQTYVSKVKLRCDTDSCDIGLDANDKITAFVVNGVDVAAISGEQSPQVLPAAFIPTISFPQSELDLDRRTTPVHRELTERLKSLAHNRTKESTLRGYAMYRLRYGNPADLLSSVRALGLRHLASPRLDDPDFKYIRALVFAKDVGYLLRGAQRAVGSFASGVNYLGPFRKDPERFYRQQELAVGQIEPHGENLAMFLRSLDLKEMEDLSEFVRAYLGFGVAVQNDGSHVAVLVEERDRKFNLIDMGYGLSQVLPVLAQCWTTARGVRLSDRERTATVLAVEQPELHLHPSHQAKLADMFAAVVRRVRENKVPATERAFLEEEEQVFPLSILIETHSEALVNRLGELVENKTIASEDVNVLLFEKGDGGSTTIREATYSDDGTLTNWPIGFFAP